MTLPCSSVAAARRPHPREYRTVFTLPLYIVCAVPLKAGRADIAIPLSITLHNEVRLPVFTSDSNAREFVRQMRSKLSNRTTTSQWRVAPFGLHDFESYFDEHGSTLVCIDPDFSSVKSAEGLMSAEFLALLPQS